MFSTTKDEIEFKTTRDQINAKIHHIVALKNKYAKKSDFYQEKISSLTQTNCSDSAQTCYEKSNFKHCVEEHVYSRLFHELAVFAPYPFRYISTEKYKELGKLVAGYKADFSSFERARKKLEYENMAEIEVVLAKYSQRLDEKGKKIDALQENLVAHLELEWWKAKLKEVCLNIPSEFLFIHEMYTYMGKYGDLISSEQAFHLGMFDPAGLGRFADPSVQEQFKHLVRSLQVMQKNIFNMIENLDTQDLINLKNAQMNNPNMLEAMCDALCFSSDTRRPLNNLLFNDAHVPNYRQIFWNEKVKRLKALQDNQRQIVKENEEKIKVQHETIDKLIRNLKLDWTNPEHLAYWEAETTGWFGGERISCEGRMYRVPCRIYHMMQIVSHRNYYPSKENFLFEMEKARHGWAQKKSTWADSAFCLFRDWRGSMAKAVYNPDYKVENIVLGFKKDFKRK